MSYLLQLLTENFNREELTNLAFALDTDLEEFVDRGKTSLARQLIQHLQRRQRLPDLLTEGQRQRPHLQWPTAEALQAGKRLSPVEPQLHPYLHWLARRCAALPLAALNPSQDERVPMQLSQVFINLDAGPVITSHEPEELASESYQAALAHIHDNPQLILLGDPGSGKTTLLKYLAYCLAQAALQPDQAWLKQLAWTQEVSPPDEQRRPRAKVTQVAPRPVRRKPRSKSEPQSQNWSADAPLPVIVDLRDFARTPFNPTDGLALWRFICHKLEIEELTAAIEPLRALAQQGQVIFLLDGVDEVPLAQRSPIWSAIQALGESVYGGCRWLTTCRILSFAAHEAPADVPVQTLRPLNEEQIEQFIIRWYENLKVELGQSLANSKIASLQQAVQRPRIHLLAQNPMLLTIMAIVQTYYTLPDERARLYQMCVETMLLRWQAHKELPDFLQELGTNQENLERLLRAIAWQAHSQAPERTDAADIPELEVLQLARTYLGSFAQAEKFLTYTEQRAHLLVGRGGQESRVYTFPHRTFQEYLAACHLASERRFGLRAAELAAQGDTWREVLNLAVGTLVFNRSNQEKALDGIDRVLPRSQPEADDMAGWYRIWLAGEMLLVIGVDEAARDEVGQELLPRVREQLGYLVSSGRLTPRQRAEAGVTLGWLGDPRPEVAGEIPYMIPIPTGAFLMGSDKAVDKQASRSEEPQHTVTLPTYAIGKYPVTVAQYGRFVAAGGYEERAYWTEAGWQQKEREGWTEPYLWQDIRWTVPNHPVVGVSWYEAVAYCNWLKATTGRAFRLPDEAMWEKAARGTDGRIYPWGNEYNANHLNASETGIGSTTAVGLFPSGQSPFEALDMSGNVIEWCSGLSPSNVPYPFKQKPYEEDLAASGSRSWRGGAFNNLDWDARAAYRNNNNPHYRDGVIGFRVAEHLSYPVS